MVAQHPDWEFVLMDRLSYAGSLARIRGMMLTIEPGSPTYDPKSPIKFVWHDFRAYPSDHVRALIGAVDYVFHFGAETHVDRSTTDPEIFVQSNVVGTYNMLEYCRRCQPGLSMFFLVSTDEVFGSAPHGVDHDEDFPHRPSNVYSATKAAAEDLAYAYNHSMGVPVIVTNTMNTIGAMQDCEKYVPKILRALMRHEMIEIHGRPGNVGSRKYIDARDHAAAIDFLVTHGERGQRYNIVGIEEIDNFDMFQRVSAAVLAERVFRHEHHAVPEWRFIDFHSARPGHDLRYSLNGSKLAKLGWVPTIPIAMTLHEIVRFTMEHPEWQ